MGNAACRAGLAETCHRVLSPLCRAGSGASGTGQPQGRHPGVSWKLPRRTEPHIGDGLVHLLAHLCNELAGLCPP